MLQAWGKTDKDRGESHPLAHHSMDVAAVFARMLQLPVVRDRLEAAANAALPESTCRRLAALAFLHDIGKLHPGFQAKGWEDGLWKGPASGHLRESWAFLILAAGGRSTRSTGRFSGSWTGARRCPLSWERCLPTTDARSSHRRLRPFGNGPRRRITLGGLKPAGWAMPCSDGFPQLSNPGVNTCPAHLVSATRSRAWPLWPTGSDRTGSSSSSRRPFPRQRGDAPKADSATI